MSYECDRKKLEAALDKSVRVLNLRDTLTKIGVQSEANVRLDIQSGGETLVSYEVPKKDHRIIIAQLQTDFGAEIEDFLYRAEAFNGFLSELVKCNPNYDELSGTLFELVFTIFSPRLGGSSGQEFALAAEAPTPSSTLTVSTYPCGFPPRPCHG